MCRNDAQKSYTKAQIYSARGYCGLPACLACRLQQPNNRLASVDIDLVPSTILFVIFGLLLMPYLTGGEVHQAPSSCRIIGSFHVVHRISNCGEDWLVPAPKVPSCGTHACKLDDIAADDNDQDVRDILQLACLHPLNLSQTIFDRISLHHTRIDVAQEVSRLQPPYSILLKLSVHKILIADSSPINQSSGDHPRHGHKSLNLADHPSTSLWYARTEDPFHSGSMYPGFRRGLVL